MAGGRVDAARLQDGRGCLWRADGGAKLRGARLWSGSEPRSLTETRIPLLGVAGLCEAVCGLLPASRE